MSQITFALQQDRMGWEIVTREKKEEQDKSLGFTTQNKPKILGFTTYMCLNHHQAYRNNFCVRLAKIIFANLFFYYLAFFYYL